jgi:low affinity Fe/Cu permease
MPNVPAVVKDRFSLAANAASRFCGSAWGFLIALLYLVSWGCWAAHRHFGDHSQMVLSTHTSIVTFLMLFLIQHSQNKGGEATQGKLDAVIKSSDRVDDELMSLDESTEDCIADTRKRLRNSGQPE